MTNHSQFLRMPKASHMPHEWTITVLGCGSSASTPKIGCVISNRQICVCNRIPFDPRNRRFNPSILLSKVSGGLKESKPFNILVDVGKTFRETVLTHFRGLGVSAIDAVLLTHYHMDAVNGLDDLREVQRPQSVLPIYSDAETLSVCRRMYPYMFSDPKQKEKLNLFVASVDQKVINPFQPFTLNGLDVIPIPMYHGNVTALGFIFRYPESESQMVYFSDFRCTSSSNIFDERNAPIIQPEDFEGLSFLHDPDRTLCILREKPINVMMLDCLHLHPDRRYISHSNFWETIEIIRSLFRKQVIPKRILLTGLSCTVDYEECTQLIKQEFPNPPSNCSIECCTDGTQFCL